MSKHTPALTPVQRIKRLREYYPGMRLMQAKMIVDAGDDAAMIAEKDSDVRVRNAAPDLLEALEELIAMDEAQVFVKAPWDASFAKAKAAVAKARGAS